jgi:hypothetical protein
MTEAEMKRKFHTTIATLLTALCIVGIAAPMASAAPIHPTGPGTAQLCADLKLMYDLNLDLAAAAKTKKKFNYWTARAVEVLKDARASGCSWSGRAPIVQQSDVGDINPVVLDVR